MIGMLWDDLGCLSYLSCLSDLFLNESLRAKTQTLLWPAGGRLDRIRFGQDTRHGSPPTGFTQTSVETRGNKYLETSTDGHRPSQRLWLWLSQLKGQGQSSFGWASQGNYLDIRIRMQICTPFNSSIVFLIWHDLNDRIWNDHIPWISLENVTILSGRCIGPQKNTLHGTRHARRCTPNPSE